MKPISNKQMIAAFIGMAILAVIVILAASKAW
jgi:hypothetical protein